MHPLPTQSADAALVTRILAGEPDALVQLMRQHNRRLFRVARSILRDDAEAEDAVQEGYIRAYGTLANFRGEARLSTWLTRIVVNTALEHGRRQRPETGRLEDEVEKLAEAMQDRPAETPETLAMRAQLRHLLEDSVDDLPEAYRSVFVLRAVEGLSIEETATCLGITRGTVKVRLLRARQQLREALGNRIGPLIEEAFAFDGARCDRLVTRVCARLGIAPPLPGGT